MTGVLFVAGIAWTLFVAALAESAIADFREAVRIMRAIRGDLA